MTEGEGWRPPRPCEAYRAEWELCRSAGHFLRHYYVHGERPACGQWRRDLASCREWEERRSAEAQVRPGDPTGPAEPWKAGNQRRWAQGAGLQQGLRVQPSACALIYSSYISVREMDFTMEKWTKGREKGFTLKGHQMA
ncbi:UPF0545 protein C22orf39 homolog isoform X1 [Cervus elaphus]|uniref:UPF0545 protein C22orf39 homolog isoform X1 n=1 Tax=Cervus canadensis TaxID=1574408 RepID=UPI001C9E4565|nr:UPF0545 protein C22orf39 homolog isoform X1 [Cervus canadensis]XP_043756986.1 UPF0545 protein C22orf39 homolog isoform X1 [Cervus elaphus]